LQQSLHRHHNDAAAQRGQAMQGGQTLRNDVRVRAELVVGQRFPIRERHHRQRRGTAQQRVQVGHRLVRALGIARYQQQRFAVGVGGTGDVPG
jgi:hypothetical protein